MITTQSRLFDITEEDTGSTEQQKRKRPAASAVNEAMEDKQTLPIKGKLVEYTKDLSLDPLSLDEARLFFGPALVCVCILIDHQNMSSVSAVRFYN